jgi:hypothetical protein
MDWMAGRWSRTGGRLFGGDGQGERPAFEKAAISGQTGHPLDAERGEVRTFAETCRPRSDASHPPRRKLFLSLIGGRNAGFRNRLVLATLPSFWRSINPPAMPLRTTTGFERGSG